MELIAFSCAGTLILVLTQLFTYMAKQLLR
jgi:hypothetical protein